MTVRQFGAALDAHFSRLFSLTYDGPDDERVQIWYAAQLLREAGYDLDEYESSIDLYVLDADQAGIGISIYEDEDGQWWARVSPFPCKEVRYTDRYLMWRKDEDSFLADVRYLVARGA
jgi:hypothetical protein